MSVSSYALASLQEVREYLGLTTHDDDRLLEDLINRASDRVERECHREFIERTRREWYHAHEGTNPIVLRHRPVTSVLRLAYGESTAFRVKGTVAADLRANVEVQDNGLVLTRVDSSGTTTTTTLDFDTYPTASDLVTQADATTGWNATLVENMLSRDLHRLGGRDARNREVALTWPDESDLEYRVDERLGELWIVGGGGWCIPSDQFAVVDDGVQPRIRRPFPMNILVEYTAGYTASTLPEDLRQIVCETVKMAYEYRQHDGNVASESLGDYSYSLVDRAMMNAGLQARIEEWREIR